MARRNKLDEKPIRPERCPECGAPNTVDTVLRPMGLPSWICLECGHREYEGEDTVPSFRKRLRFASSDAQTAEVTALVKMGPEVVPVIHALLAQRRFREHVELRAMKVLSGIGGPEAAVEIMGILRCQRRLAPWYLPKLLLTVVGVSGAVTLLCTLVFRLFGSTSSPFWGNLIAPLLLAFNAWIGYQTIRLESVRLATLVQDPALAGALAAAYGGQKLRTTVIPLLQRLLPQVTPEHAAQWDGAQKAAVIRLLADKDREMVRGALHAVSTFGAHEALAPVERLAKSGPPELREAAEAALAAIRKRVEEKKDRETLLRASSPADVSPETLLRRAAAAEDPAPEQLLRGPTDQPDAS